MVTAAVTDQLTKALINIAAQGLRTHCSDPVTHSCWLSEDAAERAIAGRAVRRLQSPRHVPRRARPEQRKEWFGVWSL